MGCQSAVGRGAEGGAGARQTGCYPAGVSTPAIRVAGNDDVDTLVALVQSAYRGEASRQGWTYEADLVAGQRIDHTMMAALVADPTVDLLVSEVDGVVVACCEARQPNDSGAAAIGMLSVDPTRQAAGLGRLMLAAAERHAAEQFGASHAELRVIDLRHELIAWYVRRGYRPTGATEPFPYGDERFGIPRRNDLRFAVLDRKLG